MAVWLDNQRVAVDAAGKPFGRAGASPTAKSPEAWVILNQTKSNRGFVERMPLYLKFLDLNLIRGVPVAVPRRKVAAFLRSGTWMREARPDETTLEAIDAAMVKEIDAERVHRCLEKDAEFDEGVWMRVRRAGPILHRRCAVGEVIFVAGASAVRRLLSERMAARV